MVVIMTQIFEQIYQNQISKLKEKNYTNNNIFYHYTSSSGLHNILKEKCLRFSNIEYLNDASELFYTYNLVKDIATEQNTHSQSEFYLGIIEEFSKYILNKERHKFCSEYYIASFSNSQDSLSLWNYYTKDLHSVGYNIAFNIPQLIKTQEAKLKENLDSSRILMGNAIYNAETQCNILKGALEEFNNAYIQEKNQDIKINISLFAWYFINDCSIFFKHPSFMAEEEYRIVLPKGMFLQKKDFVKIRESGNLFIPFIELHFQNKDISSIMISPTNKNKLVLKGLSALLETYGYENIEILNSKIPLRY